jgi:hypothetical protein
MSELSPFLVPISLFVMGGLAIILSPIARAWARRMDAEAQRGGLGADVGARLERIEQAVDAIALEVERISEGQRFTTRLLSERATERLPASEPTAEPPTSR